MSDGAFVAIVGRPEGVALPNESDATNQLDVGSVSDSCMTIAEAKKKCSSLGAACAGFCLNRGTLKHSDVCDDETKKVFEIYFVKKWDSTDPLIPDGNFTGFRKMFRGIVIEIERCHDCHSHTWCTRHDAKRYDNYEDHFKNALQNKNARYQYHVNPGPHTRGVKCRKAYVGNEGAKDLDVLYTTMVMDENTRKWSPQSIFRYPRIGAFEVSLLKAGHARVEVFSKLITRRWPNPEWLAARVEEMVEKQMGGWEDSPIPEKQKKKYKTATLTDEDLRNLMKTKFKTIMTAFRSFDKNGDGCVNKSEFFAGVKGSGVDLPKDQLERLWRMADEDNSGVLIYTEFARKFASYKATGSLHRHGTIVNSDVVKVHGMAAAQSVNKESAMRGAQNEIVFGVSGDDLKDPDEEEIEVQMTISKMARDPELAKMHIEDMTPDQVRARIYQKFGNLVTAFRHFDQSGDCQISHEEFAKTLPKVLGEPISSEKMTELWNSIDTDLTGYIDMNELSSNQVCDKTTRGAKIFKGQATMPTFAASK